MNEKQPSEKKGFSQQPISLNDMLQKNYGFVPVKHSDITELVKNTVNQGIQSTQDSIFSVNSAIQSLKKGLANATETYNKLTNELSKERENRIEAQKQVEDLKKEVTQAKKELRLDKASQLSILGIFFGFFALVTVDMAVLKNVGTSLSIAGLVLISFSLVTLFILGIHYLVRCWLFIAGDTIKKPTPWFFIVLVVLTIVLASGGGLLIYMDFGSHAETSDKESNSFSPANNVDVNLRFNR